MKRLPAALLAIGLLAGCGSSGPSYHAKLVARLNQESGGKFGTADPALNCLADVLIKYQNRSDLDNYLAGKLTSFQQLPTPKDPKTVNAAVVKCEQLRISG